MLPDYSLIEDQLSGRRRGVTATREYLAGAGQGKYSIADKGAWPHIQSWRSLGFSNEEMCAQFSCMLAWVDRVAVRPAVQLGIADQYYSSEENRTLVAKTE